MTRTFFIIVSVLLLGGCDASPPRCEGTDAKGLVAALQPREQFRAMLKMAAERTQTVAMTEARDGSASRRALEEAIERAIERYGAEWEDNLVNSWASLAPGELAQACAALEEQDQQAFMHFAQRVGPAVKVRNGPLLERAGAEILQEVWEGGN